MERVTGYKVGQEIFLTPEEAKHRELCILFGMNEAPSAGWSPEGVADMLIKNADKMIAILSEGKPQRKPRRDIGGKHGKRKLVMAETGGGAV
jgi:hypothetical protein